MRIALISTCENGDEGGERALPPLAGRSLARRQLDLALVLGCERIACLATAPSPEMVDLQHAAEKAGARFNATTGGRALASLVTASDEVLVLAPGLLTEAAFVGDALGNRPGMLVVPAERGVAAGFERVDAEVAWAGVLLMHGAAVDRLADLPPDSDPISSLLRIAAQTGLRRVLLAPGTLDSGELTLVRNAEAHARAEKRWIDRGAARIGWRRPLSAAVGGAVRVFARPLLARRGRVLGADAAGTLLTAGAAVLAWFERAPAGLAVLALGAASFVAARILRACEAGSQPPAGTSWWRAAIVDAAFVGLAVAATPRDPGFALFAALAAVVAVRLAELHGPEAPIAPAADRLVLLVLAAVAAAFGKLLPLLEVFALVTLVGDLFLRTRTRLTPA